MVRSRAIHATEWPFMIIMILVPLFMLALSCINYVNITLAGALQRLKEIGIRKVIGGSKKQLVQQFLAENMILCFCSLLAGLIITKFILIPVFNSMFVEVTTMNLSQDIGLWIFLVVLLMGGGFISGAYPAFYISSFQPVSIFRKESISRSAWLTRSLMTVQFSLAFITIIVSGYLTSNTDHLLTLNWGYQPDNTLVIELEGESDFELLRNELSQHPSFDLISGGAGSIGMGNGTVRATIEGDDKSVGLLSVGARYFESMNIPIASGREFSEDRAAEDARSVVINRAFAEAEGWTDAANQPIRIGDDDYEVIGVIDKVLLNVIAYDFPVMFTRSEYADYNYVTIRTTAKSEMDAVTLAEASWDNLYAGTPFTYFFQREIFDISYGSMKRLGRLFMAIAILSLFIACMGLFGLASQNVTTRIKEMAVRKSLGASTAHLTMVLNRKFMILLMIAGLVATPLCFFGINALLNIVPSDNLPLGSAPFLTAFFLVFATASLAVALQSRKIARVNPAEVLKMD